MGLADLICIGIIISQFGFVWWAVILACIMIPQGDNEFSLIKVSRNNIFDFTNILRQK
jgi:hypothetical protein